jgi:hypothetical protein
LKKGATKKPSAFGLAAHATGLSALAGKDAVEGSYRAQIVSAQGWHFTGSADLDTHFKTTEAQAHRWDYGIGIGQANGQELVCWVEPHSASSSRHVGEMLAKLDWLKRKLDTAPFKKLREMTYVPGRTGHPFYWLRTLSGECRITAHGREARLLAKSGLRMPAQHLTLP